MPWRDSGTATASQAPPGMTRWEFMDAKVDLSAALRPSRSSGKPSQPQSQSSHDLDHGDNLCNISTNMWAEYQDLSSSRGWATPSRRYNSLVAGAAMQYVNTCIILCMITSVYQPDTDATHSARHGQKVPGGHHQQILDEEHFYHHDPHLRRPGILDGEYLLADLVRLALWTYIIYQVLDHPRGYSVPEVLPHAG